MTTLKPFTNMHLATAGRMPQKKSQVLYGEAKKKWERWLKRDRKAIAAYYRLLRSGTVAGYGIAQASIAHRYAVVTTGTEARSRIKNMTE